jgi:hypothetical protein
MTSNLADAPTTGLPSVSYYPPILATLLASILLLLAAGMLGFFGILNVITAWGRASNNEGNASFLGAGVCGLLALVALVGTAYFVTAVFKGVRDLNDRLYFTRGTVAKKRTPGGRKANNWLLIKPEYRGNDQYLASLITDEQRAASVDRSQILQPRFAADERKAEGRAASAAAPATFRGYLAPERISSSIVAPVPEVEPEPDTGLRVVFRIDFAARANFTPDEEVLVAHSRHLEHVYYVARLRNGEWEAYRNRKLI